MKASRFQWKPDDPEIISDILFAVANVMSIARTTYLMPAVVVLGPLQIALGRMIGDITRFLVLFTLVLLAFMVGIHNIYWYYGSQTYLITKDSVTQLMHTSEAFQGMPRTLFSLFWSMFGLVPVESVEIRYPGKERGETMTSFSSNDGNQKGTGGFYFSSNDGNQKGTSSVFFSSNDGNQKATTTSFFYSNDGNQYYATSVVEIVGHFLFALYHVTIIIVLTNMLIAMMSHSFEAIQGDCDVEWKFARTRLRINYIDESNTLPVPFNMIPTRKTLEQLLLRVAPRFVNSAGVETEGWATPNTAGYSRYRRTGGGGMEKVPPSPPSSLPSEAEEKKTKTFIRSRQEAVCRSLSIATPESNYSDILQRLVRRYLFKLERRKEEGKESSPGIGIDLHQIQLSPKPEYFKNFEPAFADQGGEANDIPNDNIVVGPPTYKSRSQAVEKSLTIIEDDNNSYTGSGGRTTTEEMEKGQRNSSPAPSSQIIITPNIQPIDEALLNTQMIRIRCGTTTRNIQPIDEEALLYPQMIRRPSETTTRNIQLIDEALLYPQMIRRLSETTTRNIQLIDEALLNPQTIRPPHTTARNIQPIDESLLHPQMIRPSETTTRIIQLIDEGLLNPQSTTTKRNIQPIKEAHKIRSHSSSPTSPSRQGRSSLSSPVTSGGYGTNETTNVSSADLKLSCHSSTKPSSWLSMKNNNNKPRGRVELRGQREKIRKQTIVKTRLDQAGINTTTNQSSANIQLISLPQLDSIQRNLKLMDARMQNVQQAAIREDMLRCDVTHVIQVMTHNQQALTSLLRVLESVREEVKCLGDCLSSSPSSPTRMLIVPNTNVNRI